MREAFTLYQGTRNIWSGFSVLRAILGEVNCLLTVFIRMVIGVLSPVLFVEVNILMAKPSPSGAIQILYLAPSMLDHRV